jgi:hypothetical protein
MIDELIFDVIIQNQFLITWLMRRVENRHTANVSPDKWQRKSFNFLSFEV